jgi:hypothetical protein
VSEPSASAWCVNTRQIRRSKRRGILRAMLDNERRPLGNQSRECRSVDEEGFFFSTTDLRHDPSTLIFERGFPFAGQPRNEGLGRCGKREQSFQAFFTTASMTEGARGFRRRGANAHRSPGDGACQKQAAERSYASALYLEVSARAASLDRKAREASDIALGGELAVARRHRFPHWALAEKLGKNPGRRKRRKASRGAPQTMTQKARLLQ